VPLQILPPALSPKCETMPMTGRSYATTVSSGGARVGGLDAEGRGWGRGLRAVGPARVQRVGTHRVGEKKIKILVEKLPKLRFYRSSTLSTPPIR
jgi:hypothetical protein